MFRVLNGERHPRATPHHTTSRAATPLDMVHIDTVGPFPNHWEARATSPCSWTALPASSARTGPRIRAHRPSSMWCSVLRPTWEFRERFGRTTAPSTPTRRSWRTVTVSESAASGRRHTRHSRTAQWRENSRRQSRRGTRRVLK